MSKAVQQSPEDRLFAALDELDEAKIDAAIEALDKQIDAATVQLRQRRERLRKCQAILRGRKMRAEGKLGSRRKPKAAEGPTCQPTTLDVIDKAVVLALRQGHITAAAISRAIDASENPPAVLARLNKLERDGVVRRGPGGSGTWKLVGSGIPSGS